MGIRTKIDGAVGGVDARIVEVRSPWWREFWFRWRHAAGVYTLAVFRTEAELIADQNVLGTATHAASTGDDVLSVPIVPTPGAPLDVDPMAVLLFANGAWDTARIAWTERVTSMLLRRVRDMLDVYRAPGESLERATKVVFGHQRPNVPMPCIGVSSGSVSPSNPQAALLELHQVQFELYAWVSSLDNDAAYLAAAEIGSSLVSIVEEQRTWGGLAADTRVLPPVQLTLEAQGDGVTYQALVVCVADFSDLTGSRTVNGEAGDGGKYPALLP